MNITYESRLLKDQEIIRKDGTKYKANILYADMNYNPDKLSEKELQNEIKKMKEDNFEWIGYSIFVRIEPID